MERTSRLFVCLCVCVSACRVYANVLKPSQSLHHEGHGLLCAPNERLLSCGGCQRTCRDPAPDCMAVCRTGCYCQEDEVRDDDGRCIKLADCPSVAASSLLSSEPRVSNLECPPGEEYRSCEPCNRTCDNPNPVCPAQCARGCFCRDDLVRDSHGRCVPVSQCRNSSPLAYQLTCKAHQVYSRCKLCESTCTSPTPVCRSHCTAGCFCEDGYVKAPDGNCVRLDHCPKAAVSLGPQEPGVEDCSLEEIFLMCGWCEPSCWDRQPECPIGVCTRGCLCRPPLLRHHSGMCVSEIECIPQKCLDPNEEFVCRYGCEMRCGVSKCEPRPRDCVLGCHCKLGLYRDERGRCVPPGHCTHNSSNANDTSKYLVRRATSSVDSSAPKSVFGPIPSNVPLPQSSATFVHPSTPVESSVLFEESPEPYETYRDLVIRAVSLYKEIFSKSCNNFTKYLPRRYKVIKKQKGVTKGSKKYLESDTMRTRAFFFSEEIKSRNVSNRKFTSDFIAVMKGVVRSKPVNFTMFTEPEA